MVATNQCVYQSLIASHIAAGDVMLHFLIPDHIRLNLRCLTFGSNIEEVFLQPHNVDSSRIYLSVVDDLELLL